MSQSLACLYYHLIWSTKNRAPMVRPEVAERLYAYVGGIVRNEGGHMIAIGGAADHVHILAALRPQPSLADMLREIKASSSKWVHDTFANLRVFGWQDGYGAFTVSCSNVQQVAEYIGRQEEHHRKWTFQDEFIQFLERHHVEFNPQYVWG